MKKVIIAQTPYQIIVSLYIRYQYVKKNDQVDLIITDTFNNYEKISQRIKDKKIFSNVYIVNIKESLLPNKGKIYNLKKLYYILRPKKLIKRYLGKIDLYDEMYCWNYDAFSATIHSYFAIIKKPIKIFLYDEGYVSYFPIEEILPKRGFLKIIELRNKIFGIPDITRENVNGLYVFNPELVFSKPNYPIFKIDRNKNKSDIVNLVKDIFDVKDTAKKYDRKFIIFEEALLADNPNVDDEKLIEKIVQKVGKDNVIVKLHPRIKNNRFEKNGIKTLGMDGIPFEAITFTGNFKDKVFIAVGSNTIPNYKMFFGDDMMGIMLFKFIDNNLICMDDKYKLFWQKFEASKNKRGIHFPKSEEEFDKLLDEILKGKFEVNYGKENSNI